MKDLTSILRCYGIFSVLVGTLSYESRLDLLSNSKMLSLPQLIQDIPLYTDVKFSAIVSDSCLVQFVNTSLQFFNDSLVLGKETDSYMEKHIYDLILELNRISKTILLSVLPQLEFKLKVCWHCLYCL